MTLTGRSLPIATVDHEHRRVDTTTALETLAECEGVCALLLLESPRCIDIIVHGECPSPRACHNALDVPCSSIADQSRTRSQRELLERLLTVACGFDSSSGGLLALKGAYRLAWECETLDQQLDRVVSRAIDIGERLHTTDTERKETLATPVLTDVLTNAERTRRAELERCLERLEHATDSTVTSEQQAVLASLSQAIVAGLLEQPVLTFFTAAVTDDRETIAAGEKLFECPSTLECEP